MKPKDWTEDPYFLCYLLALAQFQVRNPKLPEPKHYISRLIVTHALYRQYLLFYEAEISTELLGSLKNPKTATNTIQWPIKPYATFPDRLTSELVAPSQHKRGPVENDKKRLHDGENNESNNNKRVFPCPLLGKEREHETQNE
ncbi:hypothetical protein N7478_001179 [Penicillium angulare]|uniref:uncharacterized protein n=1 Tax=Penicillium angulare TaxID=116970 RepID=UPI002540301B|nr:uncharacterized protein N7478_001179 [Penicillium angulare]KAJ5291928.1 hypothetical protein N7478_001179 [Penicillium angulare]